MNEFQIWAFLQLSDMTNIFKENVRTRKHYTHECNAFRRQQILEIEVEDGTCAQYKRRQMVTFGPKGVTLMSLTPVFAKDTLNRTKDLNCTQNRVQGIHSIPKALPSSCFRASISISSWPWSLRQGTGS